MLRGSAPGRCATEGARVAKQKQEKDAQRASSQNLILLRRERWAKHLSVPATTRGGVRGLYERGSKRRAPLASPRAAARRRARRSPARRCPRGGSPRWAGAACRASGCPVELTLAQDVQVWLGDAAMALRMPVGRRAARRRRARRNRSRRRFGLPSHRRLPRSTRTPRLPSGPAGSPLRRRTVSPLASAKGCGQGAGA